MCRLDVSWRTEGRRSPGRRVPLSIEAAMSAASLAYSGASDPVESTPSESAGAGLPSLALRTMKTLLIVGFLGLILYNLGAGLYYMIVDDASSGRTVKALTRRIALSVILILGVVIAASTGLIEFHGVHQG